jgi:hypothetical protein
MASSETPALVIQRQLDAYNQRDLEELLSIYSEHAELYEHPSTLLAAGISALRAWFSARFSDKDLHAKLISRVVLGDMVVDHEEVTRTFPDGLGKVELIMIYKVAQNRIVKAWALAGPKRLRGGG